MDDKEQLIELLKTMDVPPGRATLKDIGCISWLSRNLGIRNSSHPNFPEAIRLVMVLLKAYNLRVTNENLRLRIENRRLREEEEQILDELS